MRNGTRPIQQAGFPGPPPARQPPGHPHLSSSGAVGGGEGAPRGCPPPPTGFLPLAAGGESALPAGPRPYLPGPRQTQPPTAKGLSAKRAAHLPARLPERRSQLRRRGRGVAGSPGCTADTRAPPSHLPAPSAPPPADGAPGLTSPGKRKRRD